MCVDDVGEHRHFRFLETAEEGFGVAAVAVESLFKRRLILSNLSEGERGRRTDEALDRPVAAITGSREREMSSFLLTINGVLLKIPFDSDPLFMEVYSGGCVTSLEIVNSNKILNV